MRLSSTNNKLIQLSRKIIRFAPLFTQDYFQGLSQFEKVSIFIFIFNISLNSSMYPCNRLNINKDVEFFQFYKKKSKSITFILTSIPFEYSALTT